ncbi:MAG: hypothetical protein HC828_14690 [Blastochloris sp.]|nr:hypothetical protein [Blastochloris sp.]
MNEQVNAHDVVLSALNNMRPSADHKRQQLHADLQLSDAPPIIVNRMLIREAIET